MSFFSRLFSKKASTHADQAATNIRLAGGKPLVQQFAVEDWSLVDPSSSYVFIEDDTSADGPWTDQEGFIRRFQAEGDEWLRRGTAERWWNGFAWRGQPYRGEASEASGLTQERLLGGLSLRSQSDPDRASRIILVTRPTNELHLMTQHTLLYELIGLDRGSQEPGKTVLPLCHYLQRGWPRWFEAMSWLREAWTPHGPWKCISGPIRSCPPSVGALVLHVLWHGVLGSSFFSLTSPSEYERMQPEIARFLERSDVERMDDVHTVGVFRSLHEAIVIPRLLSCWSSL